MPKIVDHEERRRLIADAFATVVRRDGVAECLGARGRRRSRHLPGAMRHYFDTQTGLLRFVAQDLTERLTAQMAALAPEATGTDSVVLLEELVPLDARRQADFDVWLALVVGGLTEPALAEISAEAHAAIRNVCRHVLRNTGYAVRPLIRCDACTRSSTASRCTSRSTPTSSPERQPSAACEPRSPRSRALR